MSVTSITVINFLIGHLYDDPSWQAGNIAPSLWHQPYACHLIETKMFSSSIQFLPWIATVAVTIKRSRDRKPVEWESELAVWPG